MKPKLFMIIAGEPSGDLLAAELVKALRARLNGLKAESPEDAQPLRATLEPRFFGAGGPHLAQAGVELAFDMTTHAVVGLIEVLKNYRKFKSLFDQLVRLAINRQPDAIICVDFSGFNRRFAHAIKKYVHARRGPFNNWDPKLIQYISPQVWASREGRARQLADDVDLLLSIFPFEKDWYLRHAPALKVEYVGHPMLDRYSRFQNLAARISPHPSVGSAVELSSPAESPVTAPPLVVLLPGSRAGELHRHLPVISAAARIIASRQTVRFQMCLPNKNLIAQTSHFDWPARTTIQIGGLPESLSQASLAIASTGTVTMECAYFGVPAVTLYKTSWSTYEIAKRIIKVNFLAMPNLLAGDAIYPEFIQGAATPENIARAALEFLEQPSRREATRLKLGKVVRMLGPLGASERAAEAIVKLLVTPKNSAPSRRS